ncbi:MAG: tRNA-dihydrouridine synthase family protein [Clostridia bacterium]|nr:tRNA-dihydrouridine synthase family protein [Clostridia bacterium]
MQIYFAPLQGITDAPFRRIHAARFSGISKYFTPFISPTQNYNLTNQELNEVDPGNISGFTLVPQVIASKPELFLWAVRQLADLGYTEVNLNMGCPSGTVTAKGKGAGLLMSHTGLELFLDEIYSHSPIAVSIKTRIGWQSPDEYERLLTLLNSYPVSELIIHARTRSQFYAGSTSPETVLSLLDQCRMPLVYNGDLFTPGTCSSFLSANPQLNRVMIGRGLAANPALARTVLGGPPLEISEFRAYHDALYETYLRRFPKNAALGRMREVGKHLACCFEDAGKVLKKLRKAASLQAYEASVDALFEHPLLADPGFNPAY